MESTKTGLGKGCTRDDVEPEPRLSRFRFV